jgi:hypothetical protein
MRNISRTAALLAVVSLSACGANTHNGAASVEPGRTTNHEARMPAEFAHGGLLESAPTFVVSEGNSHMAFPPGATLTRTANGIEVRYHGVTRTFSSTAKVETGTYRRYAKAQ